LEAGQLSGLNRSGVRGIILQSILLIVGLAVLFISAGTLDWINAWVYVVLVSMYWVISTGVLASVNPSVLNERGTVVKEDTKGFDKVWVVVYPILTFGNLIVMGFDAVRFQWSSMPFWLTWVGVIVFVSVSPLALWAMAVNRFFEWTARIQDDTQQYVCTSGPYGIKRHPGYVALIFTILAYPLILGSWWGFVLGGLLAMFVVIRTSQEDRMLLEELPGYAEYARRVRYRLIPFVW
jgi:protein-S-isoprenylcysteine O-methyltransferase Ste14